MSVRELRQNLSVYLRQVQDGTTFAVTSNGRRVAVLSPIAQASRLDRLTAEGRVTPPEMPWVDPEPVAGDPTQGRSSVTQAVLDERAESDR